MSRRIRVSLTETTLLYFILGYFRSDEENIDPKKSEVYDPPVLRLPMSWEHKRGILTLKIGVSIIILELFYQNHKVKKLL